MFAKIQAAQAEMTKAEYLVSQMILENPEVVLESSITILAYKYNVSRNAISRFCQKIGYDGYTDFKIDFKKWWHELKHEASLPDTSNVQTIVQLVQRTVSNLAEYLDEQAIINLVQTLNKSERVLVLASGKSQTASIQLQRRFHQLGKAVMVVDPYMTGELDYFFKPDDIILIFSVTGQSKFTNQMVQSAKTVTDNLYCFTMAKELPYQVKERFQLPKFSRKNTAYNLDNQTLFLIMIDILINYYLIELNKKND